eukprot:tig00020660_g12550.t1
MAPAFLLPPPTPTPPPAPPHPPHPTPVWTSSLELPTEAAAHLAHALAWYRAWGAAAKVAALEEEQRRESAAAAFDAAFGRPASAGALGGGPDGGSPQGTPLPLLVTGAPAAAAAALAAPHQAGLASTFGPGGGGGDRLGPGGERRGHGSRKGSTVTSSRKGSTTASGCPPGPLHPSSDETLGGGGLQGAAQQHLQGAAQHQGGGVPESTVSAMDFDLPILLSSRLPAVSPRLASSRLVSPHLSDWKSVLRVSQEISTRIVFEDLIRHLIAVVVELAGAQRGLVILEAGGGGGEAEAGPDPEFFVEAEGTHIWNLDDDEEAEASEGGAGGEEGFLPRGPPRPRHPLLTRRSGRSGGRSGVNVRALIDQRLEDASCGALLCVNAVRMALATAAPVLVHDAGAPDSAFRSEAYVRASGVRSLLALPILNAGRVVGALYLENRSLRAAFTPARIESLQILSTQLAISILNARLYESLQKSFAALQEQSRANAAVL